MSGKLYNSGIMEFIEVDRSEMADVSVADTESPLDTSVTYRKCVHILSLEEIVQLIKDLQPYISNLSGYGAWRYGPSQIHGPIGFYGYVIGRFTNGFVQIKPEILVYSMELAQKLTLFLNDLERNSNERIG